MANRTNKSGTVKRRLSLDPFTNRVLEEMGIVGIYGKNAAEAASYVVRTWLRENRDELREMGISLKPRGRRKP